MLKITLDDCVTYKRATSCSVNQCGAWAGNPQTEPHTRIASTRHRISGSQFVNNLMKRLIDFLRSYLGIC